MIMIIESNKSVPNSTKCASLLEDKNGENHLKVDEVLVDTEKLSPTCHLGLPS